jgi:hypothetical protein
MLARLQTTPEQQTFSDKEKDSVGYFFLRLGNLYGALQMQTRWPDDESLKLAKREYGKLIGQYSREELHEAFELTKRERQIGNDRFDWPNIDAIIGLISNEGVMTGSWGTGAHRLWKPENLIGQGTERGRKKAATKALGEMKGMFD